MDALGKKINIAYTMRTRLFKQLFFALRTVRLSKLGVENNSVTSQS